MSNDFGFSGVNTIEEIESKKEIIDSEYKETIEDYKKTLENIEKLILPLLQGLYDTKENVYIKWPNRGPVLEQKMNEFKNLTRKYKE